MCVPKSNESFGLRFVSRLSASPQRHLFQNTAEPIPSSHQAISRSRFSETMESFRIVIPDKEPILIAEWITMVYTTAMTAYCLREDAKPLYLAALNLIGSIVWTVTYFMFMFASDPEAQARVCVYYGLAYGYYITEFALFSNRTASFYSMHTKTIRDLRISRLIGMFTMLFCSISDVIVGSEFGVIVWNEARAAVYCYGPKLPLWLYGFLFCLCCNAMSFMGLMSLKACLKFVSDSAGANEKDNFVILKLMLASFTMTVSSCIFNILSVLVPYKPMNYYLDHILAVATPIDTILSLILSITVFHKIRLQALAQKRASFTPARTPIPTSRFSNKVRPSSGVDPSIKSNQ